MSSLPIWQEKDTLGQWLGTPVTECKVKTDTAKGDNYMSDLHRLSVKTKEGDIALIVKCRLQGGTTGSVLRESPIFRKEQEMYSNTLPRINELLKKAFPGDLEPLAPNCYYSCNDFLVLEDLTAIGYEMFDRQQGLNLDQCIVLMRTLAKFHAASIALHEQNPGSMKVFDQNFFSEPQAEESWKNFFRGMVETLIDEMETWPALQWAHYVEKLQRIKPEFLKRMNETTQRCDCGLNVLNHGDLWTNNMLFRRRDVRLIDFQLAHFSSAAIDLQLFLTTSPNMDVRINHTDKLLQEYHSALCQTMGALGCERKLPTLEELLQEYRNKSMYGLFGIVSEAAVMLADADCGFSMDEAMKGNTPGVAMYCDFYKRVVKWHLPILDEMGAFEDM